MSEELTQWYDGSKPLKTTVRLYRDQKLNLLWSALAFTIKHSPVWIMPLLTAEVIDIVVEHKAGTHLLWISIFMVVIIAQNLPVAAIYAHFFARAVRTVETNLRMALASRLQELSIGYHRRMSAGVLQAKIVRDVENVIESTRQTFDSGMAAVTTLIGAVVLTAFRAPEFLPVFLLTVPASAFLVVSMRKRMSARNEAFRGQIEQMSARVSEMTNLIPITRAHGLEEVELQRLDDTLVNVRSAGIKLDQLNVRFGALAWIIFQILSAGCLIGAAWAALNGWFGLSAGDVVMVSTYFMQLTSSVTMLLALTPVIAKGLESIKSMGEVLGSDELESQKAKPKVSEIKGRVEFKDVHYTYPDATRSALDGVSITAELDQTVAFVGSSGSGKSTLLNSLIGFLHPDRGQILVDGYDLEKTDLRSYRQYLAVVPQESILFEGSIRDNVSYGAPNISDEQVWQALEDANATGFVTDTGGLDAVIGQRGAKLSGGQRQRIAIARALIRDPRILILDEATSALDNESERLVQEALGRLMRGRTTFVVAHRLSTIANADLIVVLENGRVLEQGTHTQLLDLHGRYAQMVALGESAFKESN